jgi:hypothetical protein
MQQFTVPQFIDVESKIIGPITTRQFLIILGAAIVVGISYRFFDFSLFLVITVVTFLITVLFAFVKINGAPFHQFVLSMLKTLRRPGIRVWNNRAIAPTNFTTAPVIKPDEQPLAKEFYKKSRLAELSLIVDTKGRYKGE